jgi:PIN domain nuclease of toxin-antitoxin system
MKLLLDTVVFLDTAFSAKSLPGRAKDLLLHPDSELYVSVASCWEIAIKYSTGKLILPKDPDRFAREHCSKLGAEILPLDEESVFHVTRLPDIHRDPFDRILICQAIVHGMVLLTPDSRISRYPVRTAWS